MQDSSVRSERKERGDFDSVKVESLCKGRPKRCYTEVILSPGRDERVGAMRPRPAQRRAVRFHRQVVGDADECGAAGGDLQWTRLDQFQAWRLIAVVDNASLDLLLRVEFREINPSAGELRPR